MKKDELEELSDKSLKLLSKMLLNINLDDVSLINREELIDLILKKEEQKKKI